MITGVELRWYISRRRVTAAQVDAYRREHSVSMMDAKRILEDKHGPTLQYRRESDCGWTAWMDVPTEVGIIS